MIEVENCIQLERSFLSLMNADCTFPVELSSIYRWSLSLRDYVSGCQRSLPLCSSTSKDGSDLPKRALEQLIDKGAHRQNGGKFNYFYKRTKPSCRITNFTEQKQVGWLHAPLICTQGNPVPPILNEKLKKLIGFFFH